MPRDLNDNWIKALQPPETGRIEVADLREAGLVFRLGSDGAATWSLRARLPDGRFTRVRLGTYPTLKIKEARKLATEKRAAIQSGGDPVAEKREKVKARQQAKQAAATEPVETVAARIALWQAERKADPSAPWSPRYAAEVARVCDKVVIPALGARPLRATTREAWTALIRERKQDATKPKKRKPGEKGKAGAPARDGAGAAAFLYRLVSAFLGYAEAQGWIAAHLLPRRGAGLIAPPPPSRTRVLSDAELAGVWRAADREPPKLRAFVRLLILTGAREKEVADMTAGEIDLAAGRWSLPGSRTKNRIGYVLPLSPLALGELAAVWPVKEEELKPSLHLLGRLPGSGFRGFGRLKLRIDACLATEAAKAGAAPPAAWRWHDLRRTARTGMTRLGVPRDHAEAAINHISGRSTLERTYDLHDFAPEVIAALTLWQGHVAGIVEKAAEVVPLASRRRAAAR